MNRNELKNLIQSIGVEPFRTMLEEFYERMGRDLMIGFFFAGKDLKHIADQQAHFILSAAGLGSYIGKGPATAHVALPPILSGHFDRRLMVLNETLTYFGLTEAQKSVWLQFEEQFRAVVVR